MSDPYLIPGTLVLKNKLGIVEIDELIKAEYEITEASAAEFFDALRASGRHLQLSMRGWQTVHKVIFRDIYDWAGAYRTIYISKENSRGISRFCAPDRIVVEGERAISALKAALRHLGRAPFTNILVSMADAYVALNEIHPFREGNGRSQKMFFSILARQHGIQLNWDSIDSDEHNLAAIEGSFGEMSRMREHFCAMGELRPAASVTLSYLGRPPK
ncbi:MAG: Fic family protein [Proteobacteria bacterium]|nr:Fic family protein [Pseudomonadota bacterium]